MHIYPLAEQVAQNKFLVEQRLHLAPPIKYPSLQTEQATLERQDLHPTKIWLQVWHVELKSKLTK